MIKAMRTAASGMSAQQMNVDVIANNLANVNTIAIGFGTKNAPAAGGPGTMYFDDIRLIR